MWFRQCDNYCRDKLCRAFIENTKRGRSVIIDLPLFGNIQSCLLQNRSKHPNQFLLFRNIIINNLISNAIKFTSKGYIKLSYRFLKANILEIKVEDTGIGISKENHQLIFERFRQVDQEANNNTAGTGLGLAITKSVVNLMGGNISLSSELGRGAVFTVTIPCKTHYLPS
jgi:K+-sensing histidine kinase KdpD